MRRPKFWARAGGVGLLALLVLPSLAFATDNAATEFAIDESTGINTMWVVLAAILVMFMQAGFLLLEVGFSRGKNAGTIVPVPAFTASSHPLHGHSTPARCNGKQ